MNTSTWMLFVIIFCLCISQQNNIQSKRMIKKRNKEEKKEMVEFAKRFIDKDCIVRTFNTNTFLGTVKEVSEGAILLKTSDSIEVINLEYVVSIKEHPVNKKGKKKSVWF